MNNSSLGKSKNFLQQMKMKNTTQKHSKQYQEGSVQQYAPLLKGEGVWEQCRDEQFREPMIQSVEQTNPQLIEGRMQQQPK